LQRRATDLNPAAIAGIVMAGLWPAFDERDCLLLWKSAPESDSGNEVFDDFVGVRPFW
jgi:hypothetical protein